MTTSSASLPRPKIKSIHTSAKHEVPYGPWLEHGCRFGGTPPTCVSLSGQTSKHGTLKPRAENQFANQVENQDKLSIRQTYQLDDDLKFIRRAGATRMPGARATSG